MVPDPTPPPPPSSLPLPPRPTGPTGKSKHVELTLDQLVEVQPGLGRLMPEVSDAFWILYYAAKGGNWGLAGYYARKTTQLLRLCTTLRPKYKARIDGYLEKHVAPLEKAIQAKDFDSFDRAYRRSVDEANLQHRETGHPEILWKLPAEPPRHLELGPAPREPGAGGI